MPTTKEKGGGVGLTGQVSRAVLLNPTRPTANAPGCKLKENCGTRPTTSSLLASLQSVLGNMLGGVFLVPDRLVFFYLWYLQRLLVSQVE